MTDCEIEQSLIHSSKLLLEGHTNRRLLEAILSEFGNLSEAFVIDWIPEQGEDIYTVVIPPDTVAIVEISRDDRVSRNASDPKGAIRPVSAGHQEHNEGD